jgi:hypothetical protein
MNEIGERHRALDIWGYEMNITRPGREISFPSNAKHFAAERADTSGRSRPIALRDSGWLLTLIIRG